MLTLCLVLSLREIRRHPGRSGLIAGSLALGVVAWTTTWALNRALDDSLRDSAAPAASADLYVSNGELSLDRQLVSRVASLDGVQFARPVVIERIQVSGRRTLPAVLLGVDLSSRRDPEMADLAISPGSVAAFLNARILRQNPVLIGDGLRTQIDPQGDSLTAIVGGKTRTLRCVGTLRPRGALSALGGSILLTGDREAAELAGHPGRVNRIDVSLKPGSDIRVVRDRIALEVGGAAEVITPDAQDGRVRESLGALRSGFALCGVGALALSLFLVATVAGVSVAERQGTIGLLRSLGSTRGQVRAEILGETLILGLIGSVVGVVIGFVVARFSLDFLLRAVGDVFVPLRSEGITFDPWLAVGGMVAGLVTSLLAAWLPASRASAMSATRAMKAGPVESSISVRGRTLGASFLIVMAGVFFLRSGIVSERARIYLALGLGLVAAVVIIPAATGWLARPLRPIAGRIFGVSGRLAIDGLIRSPARAGSAIAGLAGGVALMIQTGGVIQGNESAVRSWVDRCITGDLFLTSGGPMSASGRTVPMDESIIPDVASTLRGARIVPMRFRHLDWSFRGEKTRVLLLALDAAAYVQMAANREPPLRDLPLYRLLERPGTAIVSENFAALYGVGVGSAITVQGENGPVSLNVVGTVIDFSNNRGTILVDRRGIGRAFATSEVDLFAVGLGRGADLEAARLAVSRAGWAATHVVEAMTRPQLRGHILGMIGRLYGVAYVQEIIAACVAALGVSAAMLIAVVQRRKELGLLRALGATSAQIFATVIVEAAAMAVIGVVLGVALGMALEWYVLRVILLAETGFSFPVVLPWANGLMVAGLVVTSAIVAGLGPALSAARMGIGSGLACD
jgi:putative ABC transport system permease protein